MELSHDLMKRPLGRRTLLATTGAALASQASSISRSAQATASPSAPSGPRVEWRMATSWPPSLDTLYGTAQHIAQRVEQMSGGRFTIEVSAAGELVPGLQVLDAVQAGTVQCGHSAAYYYTGKSPALAFATAVPFGLTARQQNAWLYEGGGIDAINQVYSGFNTVAFPAGNTGVQMGGWFKRSIATVADLQGLKMRTAGLGGEVLSRLGVTVQALPAGEILLALDLGTIDAAEWVGPYDDEKLGLHKTADYYYYPSWWEPGASLDLMINLQAWEQLPPDYQDILKTAAASANAKCLADYDVLNPLALSRLIQQGTKLEVFSDDILAACREQSTAVLEELAGQDAAFKTIYGPWKAFRDRLQTWHGLGEASLNGFAVK
ncbi:MAG: TRAP transporter substrate-binding protein [Elainellaceae cyanobacterium]